MYTFTKLVYWRILSILILYFQLKTCKTQFVTVHENSDFGGRAANVSISTCSNVPYNLARDIYSVNTRGNCVRLYDSENCHGSFIDLMPRSPAHNYLPEWDFGDKVTSVGPCPNPCSTEITGRLLEGDVEVQIYNQKNYEELPDKINVNGCNELPRRLWDQTRSIQTNGHCIQLYNTRNCRFDTNVANVDTIELRPGTPHHDDLSKWGLRQVKSMSHCAYKCSSNNSLQLPMENQIFLFSKIHFGGDFHPINISNETCIDIPDHSDILTESLLSGNKTCVLLFDQMDCKGNELRVNQSISQLSLYNFSARTSSIKKCTPIQVTNISTSSTDKSIVIEIVTETNNYRNGSLKINEIMGLSPILIAIIAVVPIVGMVITGVVVMLMMRRCSPYSKVLDKLSEKEVQEFLSGYAINLEANQQSGAARASNEYSIELLAQNKAYNREYEVPRANIDFDSGAPLGAGEFGMVYKGILKVNSRNENPSTSSSQNTEKIPVAIKTVNPAAGLHGLRSLLKEVKVMLYLGQNTNIAHMIGCCTEKLRQGELMVLMEYCSGGSLESYLQKNRASFKNLVNKGRLEIDDESRRSLRLISEHVDASNDDISFNIFLITKWSIEIARGMEFLSNAKVVHSDLAARNILLTDKMSAKISDFGLSRQLYSYSQYMKKQQEPLPWRWMALESLKSLEFSTKSDVWSYGILCWEIFTLGEKPYSGLAWNEAFISNLEGGLRPNKPRNATNEYYNLMIQCWEEAPSRRPSFPEIIEEIQEIIANFFAATDSLILL